MPNLSKPNKKNAKCSRDSFKESLTVRMTTETRKMLKSMTDSNLENEQAVVRRLIVEAYERKISENVAVNGQ